MNFSDTELDPMVGTWKFDDSESSDFVKGGDCLTI
jgi:hypothetical protein